MFHIGQGMLKFFPILIIKLPIVNVNNRNEYLGGMVSGLFEDRFACLQEC